MRREFDPRRLAETRKAQKLSQRELAAKAGVSQALIAELERGKHPPSPSSLAKVARGLGVDETCLLSSPA